MIDSSPTIVCSPWFEEPLPPSHPLPLVHVVSRPEPPALAALRTPPAWPELPPRARPRHPKEGRDLTGFAVGAVCGFFCMMTLFALSLVLPDAPRTGAVSDGAEEQAISIQVQARR